MAIQVNSTLTKSRNPTEHGFKLENQKGSVVHLLPDDPFVLIKFDQFKIQRRRKQYNKTVMVMEGIEWYVHEDDFKYI